MTPKKHIIKRSSEIMGDSIADKFSSWIKGVAFKVLFSPEMKKQLLTNINLKINIPILSEKDEAELFKLIWGLLEEGFRKTLDEQ